MPVTPMPEGRETLSFRLNLDKENYDRTRRNLANAVGLLSATYATRHEFYVSDLEVLGVIFSALENARSLLLAYNEMQDYTIITNWVNKLRGQKLETLKTIEALQYFNSELALALGRRHNFRDAFDKAEPWDSQAKNDLA